MVKGFIEAFNDDMPEFEKEFGESFQFNDVSYRAISIADLTGSTLAAPGGRYADASVTVCVSNAVLQESGIVEGSKLVVRGRRVRVNAVGSNMDSNVNLICGPAGVRLS